MPDEPTWERRQLLCPKHLCQDSAEQATFIQLLGYTNAFINYGLTDDEQRAVETGIMMNPVLPGIIDGTGGIREFQFSTPQNNPGSLHLSAFYAYFPETGKVALIGLFQTDDLAPMTDEERKALKKIFEEIQEHGPESWDGWEFWNEEVA